MKKIIIYIILFAAAVVGTSWFLFTRTNVQNNMQPVMVPQAADFIPEETKSSSAVQSQTAEPEPKAALKNFQLPLDRALERAHKKPFGIFITPQNSPVKPEKFSGYHTGTDFEIFPEELDTEMVVKAVCTGKILQKKSATGYGGVVAQSCNLDGQPITVVYGHLNLESIKVAVGGEVTAGDTLGTLGEAYSAQTSGERKHLHLGFHKGVAVNILGYVSSKSALSSWLDPLSFLK